MNRRNTTSVSPEKELAAWFKSLRKHSLKLTQKELAERSGIPLGTIRYFEQTGQASLQNFLLIATELHALDLFLSLSRGEEPMTFHKIQKEKTISRLRDELAMEKKQTDPMKLREKNSRTPLPTDVSPTRNWRLRGKKTWLPATSSQIP